MMMLRQAAKKALGITSRQSTPWSVGISRLYHENVIDHFNNPRNVGSFDKNDPNVGTGLVGSPACGDVVQVQIKVDPKTGQVIASRCKIFGCGSAIASTSLVTEWVTGKSLEEVLAIKNTQIAKHLSLHGSRRFTTKTEPDMAKELCSGVKSLTTSFFEGFKKQGISLSSSDYYGCINILLNEGRYIDAVKVYEWVVSQDMTLTPTHLSQYVELIAKFEGIVAARALFRKLDPDFNEEDPHWFFLTSVGHVVTTAHSIIDHQAWNSSQEYRESKISVTVTMFDGHNFLGHVMHVDMYNDVALVVPDSAIDTVAAAVVGDSRSLSQGSCVLAFGSPSNLPRSLTVDVVSCLDRADYELSLPGCEQGKTRVLIQTDCPIDLGNSGGPLVDLDGKVVGMMSRGLERDDGRVCQGMSFAIPIETILNVVAKRFL